MVHRHAEIEETLYGRKDHQKQPLFLCNIFKGKMAGLSLNLRNIQQRIFILFHTNQSKDFGTIGTQIKNFYTIFSRIELKNSIFTRNQGFFPLESECLVHISIP